MESNQINIENFEQFLNAAVEFMASRRECSFVVVAHRMGKSIETFRSFEDMVLALGILQSAQVGVDEQYRQQLRSATNRIAEEQEAQKIQTSITQTDKGRAN